MSLEFIGALIIIGGGLGLVFNVLDGRLRSYRRFARDLRDERERREMDEFISLHERIAALEESLAQAHAAIRHITGEDK